MGEPLASQPSISRLANAARRAELYRLAQVLLETFLASYTRVPQAIVLDSDDTADEVHGAQQLALFNGHYGAYCYLPLHIYEGQSGKLITSILRPGRRPTGGEIVSILKRVVGAIRRAWPEVLILLRGDGPFSTPEVHEWGERQEPVIFYILGQSGRAVLKRQASGLLEQARSLYRYHQARVYRKQVQADRRQQQPKSKTGAAKFRQHAQEEPPGILKSKLYTSFFYPAASWSEPRRIICKVEVSDEGENLRFIVTNLKASRHAWIYETIY